MPLQLPTLLNLALKSDEIIDVLEAFDLQVIYDFDRLHENTDDQYWVSAYEEGFQFGFDANQVLKTVFAYVAPRHGFSAVDPAIVGVPLHPTPAEAQRAFEDAGVPYTASGEPAHWYVRGELPGYSLHYEFANAGALSLVTFMARDG